MPLQSNRDLHIDTVLSGIMLNRRPEGYIADQVSPVLNVSKRSDIYRKREWKESIGYEANLTALADGAKPKEVFFSVSSDTYYCNKYGLGTYWVTEDEVNSDEAIDLNRESAELVSDRLNIDFEMRIADLANASTSVYTTTNVATAWTNTTGARIFDDLSTQIEAFRAQTTKRPNTMIIPEGIAHYVRRNDQIRDLLFGDRGGLASEQQLASLLKIGKVLVPEVQVNTAGTLETKLGSGTNSDVWPNAVLLAYVDPLPGRNKDTWMQSFRWTNPKLGVPWGIRRHQYDTKRMRQDIDAIYYQSEKIISSELCFRVNSCV
tara:strand:- start:3377 stop:4333 length:957 start_codon:yes stop_codon:yes gene_type:complete